MALTTFRMKPTQPTIKIRTGLSTGWTFTNLSIAWRKIESASAKRKTPLKNAPIPQKD